MRRLSGLQKDVLILYRALLRTVRNKYIHDETTMRKMQDVVRQEFRSEALAISKLDFKLIEHKLRHGYKQKKLIEMPGFDAANIIRKQH